MFCSSKFNVSINCWHKKWCIVNVRRAVDQYVERKVEEHQMQSADFLRELLSVRDDHLVLSNDAGFIRLIFFLVCFVHDFIIK